MLIMMMMMLMLNMLKMEIDGNRYSLKLSRQPGPF